MIDNPLLKSLTIAVALFVGAARVTSANDDQGASPQESPVVAVGSRVDFINDVQPILKKSCLGCHGPEKQKGDYRLDVRETAFKGGESYAPNLVPGNSAESPLIRFVSGTGDILMPPEGERLSVEEIDTLRRWIDQGATWPDEVAGQIRPKSDLWSLKPLVRPELPLNQNDTKSLAPIDRFIRDTLARNNFQPSPQADRRTLIRRVSFDLIGLPPTPDEVDQFVADPDPKAYEKFVDRLLDSPRYGERWARHWLDTAHFAETHGNDQDRIREHAWPYRDYLIQSFNDDKPYSRFIQEQVAGDVLFPEDPTATVGLGFLAAGPWDESSLRDILEDTIDRQIARYLDRDDMLATVVNNICGMTVQCARCHDHKFDPISQHDYYSLQAVFSGVERANRRYDADINVHRQRQILVQRKRDIEQRSSKGLAWLQSDDVQQAIAQWERDFPTQSGNWRVANVTSFASSGGAVLTRVDDGSLLSGGPRPDKDTVTIVTESFEPFVVDADEPSVQEAVTAENRTQLKRITAVRLEVLTDGSLPHSGPGRQDNGNLHLSEFEVFVEGSDRPLVLANPSADFNQSGWEIAKAIDQNDSTAWGIDPQEGHSHYAIFELKEPLDLVVCDAGKSGSSDANPTTVTVPNEQKRLRFVLKQLHGRGHVIGRMRLSLTDSPTPVRVNTLPDSIVAILSVSALERSDAQRMELAAFQQLEEINRSLAALPAPRLIYAAAADFEPDGSLKPPPGPRQIHVLHRGDIRQPRDEATPGALACITTVPARFEIGTTEPESSRRAELARWLTHQDNPLTWRSIVNRIWHHHFGRGIVGTLNDFGHMGESPSHPELLDWLAVEFRDGGQSIKQLHRLILTSQTYQQTVESPLAKASRDQSEADQRIVLDADNRLLWRMNRTRLDAESIRDAVLAISGRLDYRMGGPSDRQFDLQPGIHVTPRVDYGKFDLSGDLGRRRSIYRFLFRTLPDPFMESLDCPSGDQMTPARGTNVTVQQALALWNDAFIAQHCEYTAGRIESDVQGELISHKKNETLDVLRIERAFRLILGRNPTQKEMADFGEFTRQHGLENLCRLLLNSNEFLFVN